MDKSIDNAVEMIRRDHAKISELFDAFDSETDADTRKETADDIMSALTAHAAAEEKVFYPELDKMGSEEVRHMLGHSLDEHTEMRALIERIRGSKFAPGYEKDMAALRETALDHVAEEESIVLPDALERLRDQKTIAARMLAVKTAILGKEKIKELGR